MRCLALVALAACGSHPAAVTTGAAGAPPAPAPIDAGVAIEIDAATPAPQAVDSRVPDPSVAARLPDRGILIAVPIRPAGIVIAKLDKTGLHEVLTDPDAGDESFGWIDAHTLVTLGNGDGREVTQYVDGKLTTSVEIPATEWSETSSSLIATHKGEVWLAACKAYPPPERADANICKRWAYLRVLPKKGKQTARRPPGAELHRTAEPYSNREPWPSPPTVKLKPKIELKLVAVKSQNGRKLEGVACHASDGDATYPAADWDDSSGFDARSTRWVVATPPIYEVTAQTTDPVNHISHERFYFRACSPKPFDNFAWLGDGIWAAFSAAEDPSDNGTWTIYVDDTAVGTLVGTGALRANR